jgi:hypothetical protein
MCLYIACLATPIADMPMPLLVILIVIAIVVTEGIDKIVLHCVPTRADIGGVPLLRTGGRGNFFYV